MNVLRIRNEMRNGKTIFDLPLRVTFYARVSTDKDEQINSLENQVQYYTHQNGINSALVTTILDKIIVKKGSTKEEIHLDIHLKFGGPWRAVFNRQASSFRCPPLGRVKKRENFLRSARSCPEKSYCI